MEFNAKINLLKKQQKSSCIVIGVFETYHLSPIAEELNKISENYIGNMIKRENLEGRLEQILLLHYVPNINSERVLLVGCGKKDELNDFFYKKIIEKAIRTLQNTSSIEVLFFLTELHVNGRNSYWKVRQAIEIIQETLYKFNQLKTNLIKNCHSLQRIIFNASNIDDNTIINRAIQHGMAISEGIKTAKDLGNTPPNICNASYLASQANLLAETFSKNIVTDIVDQKQIHELGMNAYLAVGRGSQNESLMSIIKYRGYQAVNKHPIVIIGKGLTFDSGGISIKPSNNMDEMKYDMCGAAAVYGVIKTIAKLKLPINVVGILASCENMISEKAYRPGDVIKTMSGKTVEVLNTDAEGRLVLCDVLTYVERFKPEVVIDVATLTGACVIALGYHITGLISNHNSLLHELIDASKQSGDLVWHLPMNDQFHEQLESKVADITNVGGRPGGVITAGCFLSKFAQKYQWAHLDIAGTAWKSGKMKSATGRPVALLSQFLLNRISNYQ